MKFRIPSSVVAATLILCSPLVQAAPSSDDVNQELKNYARNPQKFLNEHPVKRNSATGRVVQDNPMSLSQSDIQNGKFLEIKGGGQDVIRSHKTHSGFDFEISHAGNLQTFSAYQNNDLAQNVVDELKYTTLEQLESANLRTAKLDVAPWSSTYWPIFKGITADRYLHPASGKDALWLSTHDVEMRHLGSTKHDTDLSPAEKYDMLVGDRNWTLTKNQLDAGRPYFDSHKDDEGRFDHKVEEWMGICHGWAPASYMEDRPTNTVEIKSPSGQNIKFYPADIKALASLLWANAPGQAKSIGGRCNTKDKNLVKDENGRILDQDCFDTNPGTWHLAVTNQIGASKRGMVIDATFDFEVWNQPVVGYSYTYFNPITNTAAADINSASAKLSDFTADKFHKYRAINAVKVVGVAMDLEYGVEVEPDHSDRDSLDLDQHRTVRYFYDLELDAEGRILGGEWYKNEHPDFLWTPVKGVKAVSIGDQLIDSSGVTGAAQVASQVGQPLSKIVKMLIDKSNGRAP